MFPYHWMTKALTREQLQRRKGQAVRFNRDTLGGGGRAEEIASESLKDYAQRRGIQNPRRGHVMARKTIADYREELEDLKGQVQDLEEENETLQTQLDRVAAIAGGEDEDEDADSGDEEAE